MMTAAVLNTAGEPVLDGARPADHVYRLTVSSAMWRPAAVVRVQLDRTEGSVHVRTFARHHSPEWLGPLEASKDRPLLTTQVVAISAVMDVLDFSGLPRAASAGVLDGTTWTLETNRVVTYHVLLRHAPRPAVDAGFPRACRQLVTLAELRIPQPPWGRVRPRGETVASALAAEHARETAACARACCYPPCDPRPHLQDEKSPRNRWSRGLYVT